RPGVLGVEAGDDLQGIADIGPAPACAGFGDAEIAARRRAPALHADAGLARAEQLAGLMLGQHTGDVIVDHHHLVDLAEPLPREHADGRRAAPHAHSLLKLAVDDRRLAGLDDDSRAAVDAQLDRLAVAEIEQRLAGDAALFLSAMGEMVDAAEREHLRAVFAGGDVADRLALGAHQCTFGAEVAVGVDLLLDAAIAVDALR